MLWKVLAVLGLVITSVGALAAGDAAKGQTIVNNVCIACHAGCSRHEYTEQKNSNRCHRYAPHILPIKLTEITWL